MLVHQDGSQHQWVPGKYWDLIVTMDDATNEHFHATGRAGVSSRFGSIPTVYWHTPEAGGKVDKVNHFNEYPGRCRTME